MKKLFIITLVFLSSTIGAQEWKQYPYQNPNSNILFPDDEGIHYDSGGLEWWYVVMHVRGMVSGNKYSILVTHFNNLVRFFTITNISTKEHESGTSYGPIVASNKYLNVKQITPHGIDYMRTQKKDNGDLIPFEYELKTHYETMSLKAKIKSKKLPLMVGGDGFVDVGSSGQSYYYSLTQMKASGTLEFKGKKESFIGIAWMDHQWGPFLISPVEANGLFESYEWFCVQLESGQELMISNIYNRKYELPQGEKYGGVEIFERNGESRRVHHFNFKRTRYWQDPNSKHYMSMGWELDIPEWDLNLTLTPEFENQMVHFPLGGDFWEGSIKVAGKIGNKKVKGQAYGELVHRFQLPKLQITKIIKAAKDKIKLGWAVLNPDAGNPLSFDLYYEKDLKKYFLIKGLKENSAELKVKEGYGKLYLEAYSVDKTLISRIEILKD
jgi:predicted secreted hydrolase